MGKDKRIRREGTCQTERFPKALRQDYFKLDERSLADFVAQMAEYARFVKFTNDDNTEDGDWRLFFEEIYDYGNRIVKISALEKMRENASTPPHLALFLAFLRIYKTVQDSINTLTGRHLDFYYRELLRFAPREAQPGTVPVFFEASKVAKQVLVPQNTLLDAGKDKNGTPLLYATKNDLVVNQAAVDSVSLIVEKGKKSVEIVDLSGDMCQPEIVLPDVNAVLLRKEDKANQTDFGFFALASPLFQMPDGERNISLKLNHENIRLAGFPKIEYTAEDGWQPVVPEKDLITIPHNFPAITPYDEKVHQATLDTNFPVLRFVYGSSGNNTMPDGNISVEIDVRNSCNVRLKNDLGNIDGTCSFLPFGYLPHAGNDFYMINPLVFNKYLKSFQLSGTSTKLNDILNKDILNEYGFQKKGRHKFRKGNPGKPVNIALSLASDINTQSGFIRLTSVSDFGYATHQNNYLKQINETLRTAIEKKEDFVPSNDLTPFQPPKISDFSINYVARINMGDCRRYEILPAKQLKHNREEIASAGITSFVIVLKKVEEPCVVSLYFRLKDSGNLRPDVPEEQPTWHYLSGREWEQFKTFEIIKDTTGNFSQSGHVYFKINNDAIVTHLSSGKRVYLKLSFPKEFANNYPALERVHTQSVDAVFLNRDNDLTGFPCNLPATTITRLQNPVQGIKSVWQPYPACGGRAGETTEMFHARVSERLRHKNRAWNIWDYERLILEHFPAVYKVKCIPYADAECNHAPGNVLLVLLPDCRLIPQENILKPHVPQAILSEAKHLIESNSSPFVKTHVRSVSFAEVQISCTVVLKRECEDKSFYKNQLNEDLKKWISPWIEKTNDMRFGNSIAPSQVLYFIETREYVDYVQTQTLKVFIKNEEMVNDEYGELLSDDEVLTSAEMHDVTVN